MGSTTWKTEGHYHRLSLKHENIVRSAESISQGVQGVPLSLRDL